MSGEVVKPDAMKRPSVEGGLDTAPRFLAVVNGREIELHPTAVHLEIPGGIQVSFRLGDYGTLAEILSWYGYHL
jgi:hypothetical protein